MYRNLLLTSSVRRALTNLATIMKSKQKFNWEEIPK